MLCHCPVVVNRYLAMGNYTIAALCLRSAPFKAVGSETNTRATAQKRDDSLARDLPNSVIRAANEDDDLYDPYSDYHDGTLKAAEFEKDPWR